MLAKITSKNQLTLPKAALQAVGPVAYFDVAVRDGQIVLTPVRIQRGDAVRAKLAELGLAESDVSDSVRWARKTGATHAAAAVAEAPAPYGVDKESAGKVTTSGRKRARRA
jgi:hypothetical protein